MSASMPEPVVAPAYAPPSGTRYAAIILATWSGAVVGLAALVLFAQNDLGAHVPLLPSGKAGAWLSAPAWVVLLAAVWLAGLVVIALAARSGNRALRRSLAEVESLREVELRFRRFLESVPGVAFIKDGQSRFVYASPSFETYFGTNPERMQGKTVHELWPDSDPDRFRADDLRTLQTGEIQRIHEETSFGLRPTSWLTVKFPIPQAGGATTLGALSIDITAQRHAEHELLESQRRMATLLRNLPGMAYRCRDDDQRTMEFCSSGSTDLTGYAPDELVGNHRASYGHLVHPEDRERVARVLANSLRNGVPYRLTYRIVTRHGAERNVWEQGRGVTTEGTTPRVLEGFVTDVTERKRAEAEVERRSAEFRALFDQAPMSIWLEDFSICRRRVLALRESGVTDLRAWFLAHPDEASRLAATVRLLDVNAAALREYLGGKMRDTLIDPGDQLRPGALRMFVEMLAASAEPPGLFQFEGQTDAVDRDVLVAFSVLPGHEGDYSRVLVSVLDVTAVKRGKEQLRAAEQRYRALFEQAPGAILVFDPETGRPVAANPAAEALLGAPLADILKVPFTELFVDDAPDADDRLQRVLRTDGQQFEVRLRALSGGPRDVLMNLRRVEFGNGRMLQAACTDITDRKQAERRLADTVAQLEATNTDLRQLAYFASHDFSEPLRMVSGFVQLLADRVGPCLDEKGREYVRFAIEGTERMDRMIDAILRYSRVGTRALTTGPVAPRAALENALGNLRVALTDTGAEITVAELPPVVADEDLLVLLFQNLVANALKYCGDAPPRVEVTGAHQGDRVLLSVRDHGVGIAPKDYERAFQMFQRLDVSDSIPGTGVGLAICRRVVERLEGAIRIEPTSGAGTTFVIELPAAPEA